MTQGRARGDEIHIPIMAADLLEVGSRMQDRAPAPRKWQYAAEIGFGTGFGIKGPNQRILPDSPTTQCTLGSADHGAGPEHLVITTDEGDNASAHRSRVVGPEWNWQGCLTRHSQGGKARSIPWQLCAAVGPTQTARSHPRYGVLRDIGHGEVRGIAACRGRVPDTARQSASHTSTVISVHGTPCSEDPGISLHWVPLRTSSGRHRQPQGRCACMDPEGPRQARQAKRDQDPTPSAAGAPIPSFSSGSGSGSSERPLCLEGVIFGGPQREKIVEADPVQRGPDPDRHCRPEQELASHGESAARASELAADSEAVCMGCIAGCGQDAQAVPRPQDAMLVWTRRFDDNMAATVVVSPAAPRTLTGPQSRAAMPPSHGFKRRTNAPNDFIQRGRLSSARLIILARRTSSRLAAKLTKLARCACYDAAGLWPTMQCMKVPMATFVNCVPCPTVDRAPRAEGQMITFVPVAGPPHVNLLRDGSTNSMRADAGHTDGNTLERRGL
ncbi:predicted protein [Postia placenta Mad-698-R]|nr:predicted protein [Postia placenta Mad-698-R]